MSAPVRAVAALLLAVGPALSRAEDAAPVAPSPATDLRLRASDGLDPATPDRGLGYKLRAPFDDPAFVARSVPAERNTALLAAEIVGINFAMWQGAYWMGEPYAKISTDSIKANFDKGWIIDTDAFWTNQFGHPYEGSLFYTAARSTGHGPYTSFLASFLGSFMWERFMETQSSSVNDQVTTPGGGSVLGEALWRMYRLFTDSGGGGWRRVGAFAVSPVSGLNELLTGDRYHGPSLLPATWMGELHVGAVRGAALTDRRRGAHKAPAGPWAHAGAHVTYNVPGTEGFRLRQPFDHFDLRGNYSFTGEVQPTASLLVRGVLVGDTLETRAGALGLWGLFASYDVISVPIFKASGFGLGPGVSLRGRWGWFELHGTALAEVLPWAGGGSHEKLYERDYHYGPGVEGILDVRALFGNRVILDVAIREFLVSSWYATESSEDVTWGQVGLTARLVGPHAVTVSVGWARRHASYPLVADVNQGGGVLVAAYTLLRGW